MIGIYKYENKINHKIYIGQSVNIQHRFYTHKSAAFNKNVHEYNSLLSQAIREYGLENFDFQIIHEVSKEEYEANHNILNILEEHYISQYNSYKDGYNATPGGNTFPEVRVTRVGEKNGRARMTEAQVLEIRKLWATPVPFREAWMLWKDKCPSKRCFQKIWNRETWKNVGAELITEKLIQWHRTKAKVLQSYEVHNSAFSKEELEQIKKEKPLFKSGAEQYWSNKMYQERLQRDSFTRIWNKL